MWLVAPLPVGAPLAMSTLGAGARSLRAPAIPSISGRPWTVSKIPGWWTGPTTGAGTDQVAPPLWDTDISSKDCPPADCTDPMPKTYALPRLSVRMVQPSGGWRWPLLAAAEIWCCVHVVPPSWETATWSAAGAAKGLTSWPWNFAQQMYTLPKKGLDAALSAQICDLSEKVVFDCLETTTGFIHELFLRMLLEVGLSMRETAMASNPLKPPAAGKFEARLE